MSHTEMHMDHAVIWVEDIESTTEFLRDIVGFREHPMEIGVSDDDPTTGGMEGVFFDGNGVWLELIKPTTPGPGMDILQKVGAGALVEIVQPGPEETRCIPPGSYPPEWSRYVT